MSACVILYFVLCFALCNGDDREKEAKLRYYFNDFNDYVEFPVSEAHEIFLYDWYNENRDTVIFCHGFTGKPNGTAVTEVIKTYLAQGESNVGLLNWEYLASVIRPGFADSYSNWAVPNALELGITFADTLRNLSTAGLDLSRTHLIGHSLGAHIFGITGSNLRRKGNVLPWITGLDPAGIGFANKPAFLRLNQDSAKFVNVIHTDPDKYGTKMNMGTVDFWPNFRHVRAVQQPGCKTAKSPRFSTEDLCNHDRSWRLWVDAIKHPNSLIGSHAKNYRAWKNGRARKIEVTLAIEDKSRVLSGNYYFTTRAKAPYGIGVNGI